MNRGLALAAAALLTMLVAGCGSASPHNDPNATGTSLPASTGTPLPTPSIAANTPVPSTPTPQHRHLRMTASYRSFIHSICQAFAGRDATTINNALPYYKYNNGGLYYGTFNGQEGTFASPDLVTQWVTSSHISCFQLTPPSKGHGALTASGWVGVGPWGVFDLDKFNGKWKINDVDLGTRPQVMHAFFSTASDGHVRYTKLK